MKEKDETFLGKEKIWKLVLRLAIPSMLAQLVNVLYTIVDRIFIGNMPDVGQTALAAVGICGPIVTFIASFANLVGLGGAPLMAIKLGEGDREGARKILANGFVMLGVLALILTAAVLLLKNPMLRLFGASDALIGYADEYLGWYSAGSLFAVLSTGLNCFIIAQGFAKIGMLTVVTGALINIVLDPILISVAGWGVKGAAIATVFSQFCSAALAVGFLLGKRTFIKVSFRGLSARLMGKIALLGLSPFLIIATDSVMILALNAVLQKYGGAQGDTLIAGATIMLSFMQVVTMPLGGITGGTQPILSYNYGARNGKRVKQGENFIVVCCLVWTTLMFLTARFASGQFARIFTQDRELVAMASKFIQIYTLMIVPLSFQYAYVDGLTALGIAPIAITLSMFRKIGVMLTMTFVLPMVWGAEAVFYSEPIADLVAAVTATTVYWLCINRILRKREITTSTAGLSGTKPCADTDGRKQSQIGDSGEIGQDL